MFQLLKTIQTAVRDVSGGLNERLTQGGSGMQTVGTLAVGVVGGVVVYYVLSRKRRYRLPYGPLALPLVGNILTFRASKDPMYVMFQKWSVTYGPAITVYFGPYRCVILNTNDVVIEALVKRGADFSGRPSSYTISCFFDGEGKDIAFADESSTRRLRRKIATQALRQYMSGTHMQTVVHDVVTKIMNKMAAEPADFDPHLYNSTMMVMVIDMFCLGNSREIDDPVLQKLIGLFDAFVESEAGGFLEDIIPPLRLFPRKKFHKMMACVKEFRAYLQEEIEVHKQTFSPENPRDIMDSILLARLEASKEDRKDEATAVLADDCLWPTLNNLYFGSIDTSRMVLDWALYFVASFPEVQKRMQSEVDAVAGDGLPITLQRSELPYIEATLHEIMRMATIVPLGLPHKTVRDTTVGGYEVPKDTMIMINIWALHYDPSFWDQPSVFNPERFLDENGHLKAKPDSWMPFSVGRRSCLGEIVAKPELTLMLACMVKRFVFELGPGVTFDPKPRTDESFSFLPKPYTICIKER